MITYHFTADNYDSVLQMVILPMGSIAPFLKAKNETGKYPDVLLVSSTGDKKTFTFDSEVFGGGMYYVCEGLRLKLLWFEQE